MTDSVMKRGVMLFFELIQASVDSSYSLTKVPSVQDWQLLYNLAEKQALLGVCFYAIKRLPSAQTVNLPLKLKMQWLGMAVMIEKRNRLMNERCHELSSRLSALGFNSCILKGQGVAAIYNQIDDTNSLGVLRQPGDIDIWVEGGLLSLQVLAKKLHQPFKVTEQHSDLKFFDDVEVEAHFIPTMLSDPFVNRRLQRWIKNLEKNQFANKNDLNFCVPTLEFNLVYLLIHTYRHLFGEGVGLRQVMDYYVLLNSTEVKELTPEAWNRTKKEALSELSSLNLEGFTAGMMWVLSEVFGLKEELMLCNPCKKHGEFILNEIMLAGNMGHYDERLKSLYQVSKMKRFLMRNIHTFRLLRLYPLETIFTPLSRMWIWFWRKSRGWV